MDTLATIGFRADTRELDKADKSLKQLSNTSEHTESSLLGIGSAATIVGTALAALGVSSVTSQLAKFSDVATNIENRLKTVITSTDALAAAQDRLLAISNETRSEYETTVGLFTKLTQSTTELGLSQERLYRITETINKSFAASGATATEASNAITQLAQGLSAGALRGDEFNSVAEQAPEILRAVAAQTGKTIGQLREFAAEGGITAKLLIESLENYGDTVDRVYGKTNATLEQNRQIAANNATKWVAESDMIRSATAALGSALVIASENIDAIGAAVGAAAAVMVASMVPSLASMVAGFATATTGATALATATAFLTGPWGLLVAALGAGAAAFMLTKDAAAQTSAELDAQKKIIDGLVNEYSKFSGARLSSTYAELIARENKLLEEKAELESKINELRSRSDGAAYSLRQRYLAQAEDVNKKLEENRNAITAVNNVFEAGIPKADGMTDALKRTGAAAELTAKQLKDMKKAFDEREEMLQDQFDAEEELIEIYARKSDAALEAFDAESEYIDGMSKKVDEYATFSEKAAERVEEAFADIWVRAFDGFDSMLDGVKSSFKRLLAEMAHMALTKPILVSLGLGGMSGSAAAATGGAGGGLSALSGLGGMASLFGGAAGTSSTLMASGQIGTALGFTGNLFSAGQITAGIGAAMPLIAAGGAIIAAGSAISKALGGTGNLLRGGIVGDVLGGKWKTESQNLSLSMAGGDISGTETTTNVKKKFFKNRRETFSSAFDTSEIDNAFDAINLALGEAAKTFGITGADEIIKGFTSSININIKGKTEAEIQQAIAQWIDTTTGSLVNAVFGDSLNGLQKEGEGVVDAVIRLSANLSTVKSITETLGVGFDLTGRAAMIASTNIVELAGGIEQLAALSEQYYMSFYSETERQLNLQNQLTKAFAELNIAMPDSREGFRALVDGLDLTTEAGQAQFAALMKLVPNMDKYLSAIEAQKVAAEEAAKATKLLAIETAKQAAEAAKSAAQNAMGALQRAASAERELLRGAAAEREASIKAGYAIEVARIDSLHDARIEQLKAEADAAKTAHAITIDGLNAQRDAARDSFNNVKALSDMLRQATEGDGLSYSAAQSQLFSITAAARSGAMPSQQNLSAVLRGLQNDVGANSAADLAFEQAKTANQLKDLGGFVDAQLSVEEMTLAGIESQIELAKSQHEELLSGIDKQLEEAKLKYDIDKEAAKAAYEQAIELSDQQLAAEEKSLDALLASAQAQLDALLGIDNRVLSVVDALSNFNASLTAARETQNSYEQALAAQAMSNAEANAKVTELLTKIATESERQANATESTAKHTATTAKVLELDQLERLENTL